jgi:hypothetical protein
MKIFKKWRKGQGTRRKGQGNCVYLLKKTKVVESLRQPSN